jgi:hypothetical protein
LAGQARRRPPDPYGAVRARLAELAAADPLPPLETWYDDRNAGGYLPHLLRRAGIRQRSTSLLTKAGRCTASGGALASSPAAARGPSTG